MILFFYEFSVDVFFVKVASEDNRFDASEKVEILRSQAKQIIKHLNNRSAAKCSIDSQQYVYQ